MSLWRGVWWAATLSTLTVAGNAGLAPCFRMKASVSSTSSRMEPPSSMRSVP